MEYELSYEYECLVPVQEEPTDEELIQMYFIDNNEAS